MSSLVRHRLLPAGAIAAAAAIALGGCGQISNTITAAPGTADSLTVALPTAPNANYIGIYAAQSLGYFRQADLNVKLQTPAGGGVTDQLPALESGSVGVALSSEPAVFEARNETRPVVSVAAIVRGALKQVNAKRVKISTGGAGLPSLKTKTKSSSSGKSSAPKNPNAHTKIVYRSSLDPSLLPADIQGQKGLPTYNGLVIAVMKRSIVNNTSVIRRFVQATARGYAAVRSDPTAAVDGLIATVPALAADRKLLLETVKRELPSFFPAGKHPWGWQVAKNWNAFGRWMADRKLLSTANAITDASTNELLAGQGV